MYVKETMRLTWTRITVLDCPRNQTAVIRAHVSIIYKTAIPVDR